MSSGVTAHMMLLPPDGPCLCFLLLQLSFSFSNAFPPIFSGQSQFFFLIVQILIKNFITLMERCVVLALRPKIKWHSFIVMNCHEVYLPSVITAVETVAFRVCQSQTEIHGRPFKFNIKKINKGILQADISIYYVFLKRTILDKRLTD